MVFRHTATGTDLGWKQCGAVWASPGAGRKRSRFLQFLQVRGGFIVCGYGTGAEELQPAKDSNAYMRGVTAI